MKKIFVLIILFVSANLYSNEKVRISLLTCSQGEELYSSFAHSAIRIVDSNKYDIIYNFGIFDFNVPNFYPKFLNGIMIYRVGKQHTIDFIDDYTQENRWVVEQELFLNNDEKKFIIDILNLYYLPENRNYLYDFMNNNCSTKLRDIILFSFNREIKFDNKQTNKTYRDLLNESLKHQNWARFFINIILGSKIDKYITPYQAAFLPYYLSDNIDKVFVGNQKLTATKTKLNNVGEIKFSNLFFLSPVAILSLMLIIIYFLKNRYFENVIYFLIGLLGLILTLFALLSQQIYTYNNFNLLLFCPLYLLLPFLKSKFTSLNKYLLIALLLFQLIILFVWIFKIQGFDIAFIAVFLILLLLNYRRLKFATQIKNN